MESANNLPLVWVHGDCLDPQSPALRQYPGAKAIFVFDDELLAFYNISLKRLVFLYECLLEIPNIEIRKGDVITELTEATREYGVTQLATVYTPAPRFRQLAEKLRRQARLGVEVLDPDPFIPDLDEVEASRLDLKRFSRYWQAVSSRV